MGRYYNGDIEGKFWFGVQSSTDADFFGVNGQEPNYVEYYFEKENIEAIQEGIDKCIIELGIYADKLTEFFKANKSYSDKILAKYLEVNEEMAKHLLKYYARLELGEKILACVKENGSCEFEAEL